MAVKNAIDQMIDEVREERRRDPDAPLYAHTTKVLHTWIDQLDKAQIGALERTGQVAVQNEGEAEEIGSIDQPGAAALYGFLALVGEQLRSEDAQGN